MGEEEYVSQAEAARQAGVSRGTIQRWIREGKLYPYKRVGMDNPLVRLSDVMKLVEIVPFSGGKNADDTSDER